MSEPLNINLKSFQEPSGFHFSLCSLLDSQAHSWILNLRWWNSKGERDIYEEKKRNFKFFFSLFSNFLIFQMLSWQQYTTFSLVVIVYCFPVANNESSIRRVCNKGAWKMTESNVLISHQGNTIAPSPFLCGLPLLFCMFFSAESYSHLSSNIYHNQNKQINT